MDKKTLAKIKQWQEFKELDPDLKKELDSISNDEAALMDAFYNDCIWNWWFKRCSWCRY